MLSGQVLFSDPSRDLVLEKTDEAPADLVQLLRTIQWGTKGVCFVMDDVAESLARMPRAHYLTMRQRETAVASIILVPRLSTVDGFRFESMYRCLLAVTAEARSSGLGTLISQQARRHFLDERTEPTLLYGMVENANERSMRVQRRIGYEALLQGEITNFGYVRPRANDAVMPLARTERAEMREELAEFYADYCLGEFDASFDVGEYWVLRAEGIIVAGAQVTPRQFTVTRLDGFDGMIVSTLSPVLQHLNPFFRLKGRRFLCFGNVFFRGRDAKPLTTLFEAIMQRCGLTNGVLFSDRRSSLYAALQRTGLGPLEKLAPSEPFSLMAGHQGLPDSVVHRLRTAPAVFSPVDCF